MALADFLRSLASPFMRRTVAPPGAPTAAPSNPPPARGEPASDLKDAARATVQKIRTAWLAGRFHLLPWLDLYTEETDEIRRAYPVMLREPVLQAALLGQVSAVASQEAQVHADDPDDPRQAGAAKAALHALKKVHGGSELVPIGMGTRHVAWSVLSGAVLKGWSLSEVTLRRYPERTGPAKGKIIWESFKAKDTDTVQLVTDRFWGISGVKALRYNPGVVFEGRDLHSFVVFNRFSLYEHPIGISAFRSAYRAFWIKDTAWKLRALHLDRFTHPYFTGTYTSIEQKAALEEALEEMRGAGWATLPVGGLITAIDIAARGTADFESAIRDCNEEMLTGVCGAYLHMMTGQTGQQRGSSEVQKETTELFQWALSAALGDTVTAQMLKPWYEFNYHDMEPGTATWGAVSEQALQARANLDKTLQEIGLGLSKKEAYSYFGRQRPADKDDVLGGDKGGGGGGGGPGGGVSAPGQPPGGGDQGSPFSFAEDEPECRCKERRRRRRLFLAGEKKDKLGRRYCWDDQTGKRVPCPPKEGEAPKEPRKKAAPKPKPGKPTVDEVHAAIGRARQEGLTPEHLHELTGAMAKLTLPELGELKKKLGVRAGGKKAEQIDKIKAKALDLLKTGWKPPPGPVQQMQAPVVPGEEGGWGWGWGGQAPQAPAPREEAVGGRPEAGTRGNAGGGGPAESPAPADRGPVAPAPGGPGGPGADQGGDAGAVAAGAAVADRVPATPAEVTRRIDRFEKFFRDRGQGHVADWMGKLREHIATVGTEEALRSLGEDLGEGEGGPVQYEGAARTPIWDSFGGFTDAYLRRHGITSVVQGEGAPGAEGRLVSSMSPTQGATDQRPAELQYLAGDFSPTDPTFKDKLEEAKHLPGLEKSEDLGILLGQNTTHLTSAVTAKLDEHYGPGQWIVKAYGDEAAAGFGIYFPQRAAQIAQDARNTLWSAGENLARYGFELRRDEAGGVVGLKHQGGDVYDFGTDKYAHTIHGDARHWGDRAAEAAGHEKGAELPLGGRQFMAQPAFKAVGVSDADRAAGRTIAPGEGRVHIVTRGGKAEVIPASTWIKGEPLPVVFESEDTRAMAKAALDAIHALPESERSGQIYAPDIIKAEGGYRVVEANPANQSGSSGYLGDNPFIIDAYTSHLTGRSPAHVRFIRSLLTSRKKGAPS